ncbi:MAG: polymorphic toxin type 50 domain-containing protein [Bradymonadia bacterium]|jgi:hypothetical protein
MGTGISGLDQGTEGAKSALKINKGQQDKHIVGTHNYQQGLREGKRRSILTVEAEALLREYAGTGVMLNKSRERIECKKIIGIHVNPNTGEMRETKNAIIHYGKKGAHIVPALPEKGKRKKDG